MDLEQFVAQTLIAISGGISKAQAKPHGAIINPRMKLIRAKVGDGPHVESRLEAENLKSARLLETNYAETHADIVEFDVAVTVSTSESAETTMGGKTEIEGKIVVASGSLDLNAEHKRGKEGKEDLVSRVKFRVPVAFPMR